MAQGHTRNLLCAAWLAAMPAPASESAATPSPAEEGKDICGDFRFVHVWRNAGGKWQLARVISYGHKIEE